MGRAVPRSRELPARYFGLAKMPRLIVTRWREIKEELAKGPKRIATSKRSPTRSTRRGVTSTSGEHRDACRGNSTSTSPSRCMQKSVGMVSRSTPRGLWAT